MKRGSSPCFCYTHWTMKEKSLKGYAFLLLVLLSACVAPGPKQPELAESMRTLPGAIVSTDGRHVEYPGESLFAEGAVLPLPGGMEMLGPLVDLMLANPGVEWTGTVRSDGPDADYQRRLAEKRKELLTAVFRNRGLTEERLVITTEVGPGAPLELEFQPVDSVKSEAGNR